MARMAQKLISFMIFFFFFLKKERMKFTGNCVKGVGGLFKKI